MFDGGRRLDPVGGTGIGSYCFFDTGSVDPGLSPCFIVETLRLALVLFLSVTTDRRGASAHVRVDLHWQAFLVAREELSPSRPECGERNAPD